MVMIREGGHEYDHMPPKFLQIKQEDKFFSRLLSKETSKGEASFRVLYYGGTASAIPFTWETSPGTPKHTFSDASLPPLTPPPSYQLSPGIINNSMQKQSKSKFLHSILLRMSGNKSCSTMSASSSASSSSSYSLPSTPMNSFTSRRKFVSRSSSAVPLGIDDDEDHEQTAISPTSTLCFGGGNRSYSAGKFRSYYGIKNMKKAVLSMVGHGTAQKCS